MQQYVVQTLVPAALSAFLNTSSSAAVVLLPLALLEALVCALFNTSSASLLRLFASSSGVDLLSVTHMYMLVNACSMHA
jgi:hypothetical protein